jgi:protein-S-isoprenylcysteine O-methyltransferase Ste14
VIALTWALHLLFWAPFVIRGRLDRQRGAQQTGPAAHADPWASGLVWLHGAGIGVTYAGLVMASLGGPLWPVPTALRLLGVPIVVGTTWMILRVMMVFRSWRLRAALAEGHQLCTEGFFERVRHPIYTGMALLTVGTLLLVPNPLTVAGVVANFAAGDIRARAEERLLLGAFGARYATYMARTRRFVPGLY